VKIGDLISFKPYGLDDRDWSPPCVVLREWEHLDQNKLPLWVIWCCGYEVILDNDNYEVVHLTSSSQHNP